MFICGSFLEHALSRLKEQDTTLRSSTHRCIPSQLLGETRMVQRLLIKSFSRRLRNRAVMVPSANLTSFTSCHFHFSSRLLHSEAPRTELSQGSSHKGVKMSCSYSISLTLSSSAPEQSPSAPMPQDLPEQKRLRGLERQRWSGVLLIFDLSCEMPAPLCSKPVIVRSFGSDRAVVRMSYSGLIFLPRSPFASIPRSYTPGSL